MMLDGDPEDDVIDDLPDSPGGDPENQDNAAAEEPDDDDPDGDGESEVTDELVEVKHGDKTYKVPKDIQSALLFQSDYSRKTEELAKQRQALEDQQTQQRERSEQNLRARGYLAHLDAQIDAYKKADWDAARTYDKENGTDLVATWRDEQQSLREKRDEIKGLLDEEEKKSQSERQASVAKRIEEARAVYDRKIPGWSREKDPVSLQVMETAHKTFGYSLAELGFDRDNPGKALLLDPRFGELAYWAHIGKQLTAKQAAAAKRKPKEEEAAPQPAKRVGSGTRMNATPQDRDDIDTWMKKRNKQIASQAN